MVLYRVRQPLSIRARITGRYTDGWTGSDLTYARYGCKPGRVIVTVSRYPGLVRGRQLVSVVSDGRPTRSVALRPGEGKRLSVPVRPAEGECTFALQVSPTASPATVLGGSDQRQLGVHVDRLRYVPGRR